MPKLKVGVNGRYFSKPYVGIGRYSINVFAELARKFPDLEFEIALVEKLDEQTDRNLRYLGNLRFELIPENGWLKRIHPGLAKSYWEKVQLNKFFLENSVQLIHLPYPSLYKKIEGVPTVVTAHDAITWTDKKYAHRNRLSSIYNKKTLEMTREADLVITVSASSKKELLELEGFGAGQIRIVYNASEFSEKIDFEESVEKNSLSKFGIDKPYIFYMGGYDKRKNTDRLIKLFLDEIAIGNDIQLVLGGGKALNNSLFDDVKLTAEQRARVKETGFLTNQELMILYKNALAYLSLTKREGFNLPLLEALSLGTPVFISDLDVHREIGGELPIYLSLEESNQFLGKQIVDLLNSKSQYNELKLRTMAAQERIFNRFSWKKAAEEIGQLYQQLL